MESPRRHSELVALKRLLTRTSSVFLQDSVSDVMELLKRQEDLEAMIQAQSDRFIALQKKKTQVTLTTGKNRVS